MVIFVDTSAFYALLDADDRNHHRAKQIWLELLNQPVDFVCSNYILVESIALIQRRLGIVAVRRFQEELMPIVQIKWIEAELHKASISALLATDRRQLSLVDCASFEVMRRLGIRTVFAFDDHFIEQGFTRLPA
jgi:predicted nucleic acid-binding protein